MHAEFEINHPLRRWMRVLALLVLIAVAPFAFIAGCQSKLIYFPRPYAAGVTDAWRENIRGRPIHFTTSQGRQRAFLQGKLTAPRNLWIVCGGNGTVALDWADWIAANAPAEDAWLLVDFPGYGDCEGKPSPQSVRESLRVVVPMAAQSVGLTTDHDASRLRFFGHSLGAAACLIAAVDFDIRQGVLVAPFTSTMEMSRQVTGLPLGFLVTHRYDNAARLDDLVASGPTKIVILHGTDDEVIPVEMGRTLARDRGDAVRLVEIEGARHNDIAQAYPEPLVRALQHVGL